jgi:hypothetical protein
MFLTEKVLSKMLLTEKVLSKMLYYLTEKVF